MLLMKGSNIMASAYIVFEKKILYNLESHYEVNYVLEKGLKG